MITKLPQISHFHKNRYFKKYNWSFLDQLPGGPGGEENKKIFRGNFYASKPSWRRHWPLTYGVRGYFGPL